MISPRDAGSTAGMTAGPPAVVIGLDSITGLQTARILAGHGVSVIGMVTDRRHWGARTNACTEVVESVLSGPGLTATLLAVADRVGRPLVLVPCTDQSVATVSRHRDELGDRFLLPLGPPSVVELLMDKVSFARHAQAAGLPVPRTEILASRAEAVAAAAAMVYPCIIKPPVKAPKWDENTSAKGFAVNDATEFMAVYDRVAQWAPLLIAQEWIRGGEDALFSCNAYFGANGEPLVTFVARKLRQWPPNIGTSASGEECRNDEVLDATVKLFGGLGFRGLAYVEMKRDTRTGRQLIIEPNVGRPTGRSAIAEAGGVDLVYTAYCDAAGLPLPAGREQRYVGTKWLDLRRDLQAAVVAVRKRDLTVGAWVRSVRGPKAHAIWSRSDPLPFVVDLGQAARTGGGMVGARVSARLRATAARRRTVRQRSLKPGS